MSYCKVSTRPAASWHQDWGRFESKCIWQKTSEVGFVQTLSSFPSPRALPHSLAVDINTFHPSFLIAVSQRPSPKVGAAATQSLGSLTHCTLHKPPMCANTQNVQNWQMYRIDQMANYMLFKYIMRLYEIDTSAAFCTSPIGQIKTTVIPIFRIFRIGKSLTGFSCVQIWRLGLFYIPGLCVGWEEP